MILEAFACGVFSVTEFTKTQHYSLEENTKEKILSDGLYHFTSKEVANKIVQDKYFRPTKGRIKNHLGKDKVYMFAGLPDMANFSKNLPAKINPFVSGNLEFSAVKLNPNEQELSHFKERLQDSAVVYEGRYDIGENRARAVELVVDLDKEGNCIFREKTKEELENGYVPSEDLLQYIEGHKIGKARSGVQLLYEEVKAGLTSLPNMLPRVYRDFKDNRARKREIKEFEPYSFEMGTIDENGENTYSVSCDKLEFYGDKKLNRVSISKEIKETGETSSYDCYIDSHILNLGDQAAAIYLKQLESAIKNNMLNNIDGIYYAGEPMFDIQTGNVTIGVDAKFNELLKERNRANFFGERNQNSDNLFNKKLDEYYKRHPIRKFLDKRKIKKGEIKMLADRNEIGKYTNEKLSSFSLQDAYQEVENTNGFDLSQKCDFEYKAGSKYSVLIGDTVEVDGKRLVKLMVGEENYLSQKLDDTVRIAQNYYMEVSSLESVNKKDLAKYFASLGYDSREDGIKIEESGFVGKYVGGIDVDKKGRIKGKTYDESMKERCGNEIHIQKQKQELDMSYAVYNKDEELNNYARQHSSRVQEDLEIDRQEI